MIIRAVILDIGGVLIDVDFSKFFQKVGVPSREIPKVIDSVNHSDFFDAFERGKVSEEEFRHEMSNHLRVSVTKDLFEMAWNAVLLRSFPGVEKVVSNLRSNMPVCLLTNSNSIHMRHMLENYSWFKGLHILASHELGLRKPETEIYERAVNTLNLTPEHILFVDDRSENVKGAKEVGLKSEECSSPHSNLVEILTKLKLL